MKVILIEYGRLLMYALIGIAVFGIVVTGVQWWYSQSYPDLDSYQGISVEFTEQFAEQEPIIIGSSIEIPQQEIEREIDFAEYIWAYEDSDKAVELEVEIIGGDKVDITTEGIYQILCRATNSAGYSFTKRIPVLIY